MYAIGKDLATGDVIIRNYANGTDVRIPADDITLVADMIRNEYPECEFCEGTRVDGYCTDCGRDFDGSGRAEDRVEAAEPGGHDHVGACVLCGACNESCCEHCPGNPAYDRTAVQAALDEEVTAMSIPTLPGDPRQDPNLVHIRDSKRPEEYTACGLEISDDTLIAEQDFRGHTTCGQCRIEGEL